MNETRVFAVTPEQAKALEQALRAELPDVEWRTVDHATFAAKTKDASIVCYRSGKLVLQGRALDAFAARFLSGLASNAPPPVAAELAFDAPAIGSDEAGKGDYFGPLVVAAVYAEPGQAAELQAMGVADSKTLGDRRMFPMAERIERTFACEVRELMPEEYNARWTADPNVNHLLADLHAGAIAALLRKHPEAAVVVDRFGDESLIAARLAKLGAPPKKLVVVPRADAGHPAVGAASVVARVRFVEGLKRCEQEAGTDLHLGAGPPADAAAERVARIGGRALLAKVAKIHFKNTARLPS